MLSTAGEELADGVGESDTLIEQEESVLVGSSNRKTGSNFQPVCRATLGHSFSRNSTSDLSPLTTNHHFLMVPFWNVLNFLLIVSLSPRGADVSCLMAFIITG